MGLVATPEGPVVVDGALDAAMKTTGYVSSFNGKQGAVSIDLSDIGGAESVGGIAKNAFNDVPIFKSPGGTVKIASPEHYGAKGNGTDDDTAAFVACDAALAAAGGGIMYLQNRRYKVSSQLVFSSGVEVEGCADVYNLIGSTGTNIIAAPGFTDSAIVSVQAAAIGTSIRGVNVVGHGKSATALAGVHIPTGTTNIAVRRCWIGSLSDTAVRIDGGVRHFIEQNVMGYDVTGRTLTSRCGTLEVNGTDHIVHGNEISAGPSNSSGAAGYAHVTYSSTHAQDIGGSPAYYRTAVWVRGGTHDFAHNVAEFGDVNWFYEGAVDCASVNDRSDYSSGHGVIISGTTGAPSTGNVFTGIRVFGAGFALLSGETPVRHGVIIVGTAKGNEVDFRFWIGGVAPQPCGYAFADYTIGNTAAEANTCFLPYIAKTEVIIDTIWRSDPSGSCYGPSVDFSKRPPSRHSHGAAARSSSGVQATSDGTHWVDDFGDAVGNICPPRQSEMIPVNESASTGLAWEPLAGGTALCSTEADYWQTASADGVHISTQAQKLIAPTVCKVTVLAAGHTAGYVEIGQAALLTASLTDMTGLALGVPGEDYTIGIEFAGETADGTYTIQLKPRWWNTAGTSFVDGTYGITGGGTSSTSDKVFAYLQGQVCPVGFPRLEVVPKVAQAGLPTGRVFWIQHAKAAPGAHTAWSNS